MKKLILLSIMLIVGCDEFAPTDHTHTQTQDVYGCTDAVATNFDSTATIFDNTCEYPFVFLKPTEGEIWCIGSTYTIEWTGGNINDIIGRLHYSDVDANTVELSIATDIVNSGSYEWVTEVGVFGIGEKRLYIENKQQTQWKHSAVFSISDCNNN